MEKYGLQNRQAAWAHTKNAQIAYKIHSQESVPVTTTLLVTIAMTSVSTSLLQSQQNQQPNKFQRNIKQL